MHIPVTPYPASLIGASAVPGINDKLFFPRGKVGIAAVIGQVNRRGYCEIEIFQRVECHRRYTGVPQRLVFFRVVYRIDQLNGSRRVPAQKLRYGFWVIRIIVGQPVVQQYPVFPNRNCTQRNQQCARNQFLYQVQYLFYERHLLSDIERMIFLLFEMLWNM